MSGGASALHLNFILIRSRIDGIGLFFHQNFIIIVLFFFLGPVLNLSLDLNILNVILMINVSPEVIYILINFFHLFSMVLADRLFHHMVGLLNVVNGGFEVADFIKHLEVL